MFRVLSFSFKCWYVCVCVKQLVDDFSLLLFHHLSVCCVILHNAHCSAICAVLCLEDMIVYVSSMLD